MKQVSFVCHKRERVMCWYCPRALSRSKTIIMCSLSLICEREVTCCLCEGARFFFTDTSHVNFFNFEPTDKEGGGGT